MKKIIVVLFVLLLVSSLLFAGDKKEEKGSWSVLKIVGVVGLVIIFTVAISIIAMIVHTLIYGGRTDAGALRLTENSSLNLKLKEWIETEEDQINLEFIIKKIVGNKITLRCKIFRGTKEILTRTFGVDKTQKVTRKIKEALTFPIDISIDHSSNPDKLEIEVERIIPENLDNNAYLYMQNSSNDL